MPTPSYISKCTQNRRIARDIYEVKFEKPENLNFIAGQYVLIDVPLVDNPNDIQTRAFSIASSPNEKELLFAMKMKEGGRASRWIMEKLQPGDSVRMQGPFGRFLLDRESQKNWFLVCTSTGIAPFRSQLLTFLPDPNRKIDILYGVRSEEDLFWKEEFDEIIKKHPNVSLHVALSQPSPTWKGKTGRVQALLPDIIKDWSSTKVYVCGNPEMTKEMKKICMENYGVTREDFHMEGYI